MDSQYAVVVVGGGQAGVCAAVAAAQSGQRVLLVQDRPMLGGNASSECGVPAHGAEALGHNRNLRETGLMEDLRMEFYCRLSSDRSDLTCWDSLLAALCAKTDGLTVLLNARAEQVTVSDGIIRSVRIRRTDAGDCFSVTAPIFLDATGDGTLGFLAGAEYRMGRECRDEFSERILGRETADRHTLGCSIYGHAIRREHPVSFTPPEGAASYPDCASLSHRSHDVRSIFPKLTCREDGSEFIFFWWLEWGGELDVTRDEAEIYAHLQSELFGVWDHLKNRCSEETVSALRNYELAGWTAFPLKRESRRLVGDYILNENDLVEGRLFPDVIGYGGWPMDDHPPMGIASREPACDQLFLSAPYTVPFRCCYSKNIGNLLMAGRCISVTHAALSSVRVMNTLAAIGEAVGVAAAMCAARGVSPRVLAETAMHELQQAILARDLYLPGVPADPEGDLARFAHVSLTSSRALTGTDDRIGSIPLTRRTALRFPVSTDRLDALRVRLTADRDSCVRWQLLRGETVEENGTEPLAEGVLSVSAGSREYALPGAPFPAGDGRVLTLILDPADGVSWDYGTELYHTRWALEFHGKMEGLSYHGASHVVARSPFLNINGCGRLPAELALDLQALPGFRCHDKPFLTPCFRVEPPQYPYTALTNGVLRSAALPNLWISGAGLPQSAVLSWDAPVPVRAVELYFDTDLDLADQRYGFPRGKTNPDRAIPAVIPQTVSDFTLSLRLSDGSVRTQTAAGNFRRRCTLSFPDVPKVCALTLTVTATRGVNEARVFGIRVLS